MIKCILQNTEKCEQKTQGFILDKRESEYEWKILSSGRVGVGGGVKVYQTMPTENLLFVGHVPSGCP